MKLLEFLTSTKTSRDEFARSVDIDFRVFAKILTGERIPRKTAMAKIVIATKGLVQPNDFYAEAIAALKALPS